MQECWEACRDRAGCQSWYWCDQREGCMDDDGRKFAYQSCELRSKEVIRMLGQVPAEWRLPTFAAGFMKRAHTLGKALHSMHTSQHQLLHCLAGQAHVACACYAW